MSFKEEYQCNRCPKRDSPKNLKKIGREWVCKNCYRKGKKKHREFLKRDILGIRKREDMVKEWAEKRKQREREEKERAKLVQVPKIKGAKKRAYSKRFHLYITSIEKQVLYRKYTSQGLDSITAGKKVKDTITQINTKVKEWYEAKLTDKIINEKFKEEFAQLIMRD